MTDFNNMTTYELYINAMDKVIKQTKDITSFLAITHITIESGKFDTLDINERTKSELITELSVLQEAIKHTVPMIVAHTDNDTLSEYLVDSVIAAVNKHMNQ